MVFVTYQLEHFYYGQYVRNGKPEGELRLLASSPGIRPDHVTEAIQRALVPPLGGSWAVVRGRSIPFIMAQSQLGKSGQSMLHFVLMPVDVLKALGGNLRAMMTLVETEMPVYDQQGATLAPLNLPHAEPPPIPIQVDEILELMTYTRNHLDTMEALLAALVQGVQIIVLNAPRALKQRVGFIEGLLALLPPPARFGVTFATHTVPNTMIDAQIRFLSNNTPPEGAMVFDWGTATLSGTTVEDEYSRFIISQLRLDTDFVIQQTQALTSVAAWRIRRGDKLAEALGYASYRLKVDNAVMNSQPVEVDDVARVLTEDTTLTEELQSAYARHLLALTLAMGDTTPADVIAPMVRKASTVESTALRQFTDALEDGKSDVVYTTLVRWLDNPLGPHSSDWIELTHRTAIRRMENIVKAQDSEAANRFLNEIHQSGPALDAVRVVPKLFEMALGLSVQNKKLAQTLFLLAVDYLDSDRLNRLLNAKPFVAQLAGIQRLIPYLAGEERSPAPPGLLIDVVNSFDERWRPLILIRLAEISMIAGRTDLLSTPTLSGLVQSALSPWGRHYDQVLRWIINNLSGDETLLALDSPGPRHLLQILLALGAYREFITELLHQARVLYPGESQNEYASMIERLFAETPISVGDVTAALRSMDQAGIKSLPLIMAHIGALECHRWNAALDSVVSDLTTLILDNRKTLQFVHPSALLSVLNVQVRREDVNGTIRMSTLLPTVAARQGADGAAVLVQSYRMMLWDDKVKIAAMELLRRYIRLLEDTAAQRAVSEIGAELGEDIRKALYATYIIKRLIGDMDLIDYAAQLHVVAEFLQDTAQPYVDPKRIPQMRSLISDLDSITGGVENHEREAIAREILTLGRSLVTLAKTQRSSEQNNIDALLNAKADPQGAVGALWVIGGYFARGTRFTVNMESQTHIHVLGARSAPNLLHEAETANRLLRNVLRAFPPDRDMRLTTALIRDEIESAWGEVSLHDQRQIVRTLAEDFQRIAALVTMIAANGDAKALGDGGLAQKLDAIKQRPRSTLEYYRLIHGYFMKRSK